MSTQNIILKDNESETSFNTALTPDSSTTASPTPLDILDADPMTDTSSMHHTLDMTEVVPWPGKTFIIMQKGTTQAITLLDGHLSMQDAIDFIGQDSNRWMCVEQNGYFGFYNKSTMTYLGHDNKGNVTASARKLAGWELITPRRHPNGGYQLLSPHWAETLHSFNVAGGTGKLVRVPHGDTIWEFETV